VARAFATADGEAPIAPSRLVQMNVPAMAFANAENVFVTPSTLEKIAQAPAALKIAMAEALA